MPKCPNPISVLEPAYPEMVPVDSTEIKMTAFIMCASGSNPALRYATTNGEAFVPSPPNRLGSSGETVIVTMSEPRM